MRILLGFLVLASLFWMAASWQARHTGRLRREREQIHGRVVRPSRFATPGRDPEQDHELSPPPGETSAGWSTLVIGRPSGADPRPGYQVPPEELESWASEGPSPAQQEIPGSGPHTVRPPTAPPAFRYRVRSGDVLGTICADYYGAERGPFDNLAQLSRAVAQYNEIHPDSIGAGDEILLPALVELDP